jgi:hypothetical protein
MFHRPFAYLMHITRLEYAYTTVASMGGADECYICLRKCKTVIPFTQFACPLPFHAAMYSANTASTNIEKVQMTSNYARSADGSYKAH